jgi:hypothetical protein
MMEFMQRGFDVQIALWDNTEPTRHCDGSDTMSDGHVAVVILPAAP